MAPAQASPFMEEDDDDNEEIERMELETSSSYYPSAPSSEIFDTRTTVDPSYIISLIRNLLPHNVKNVHPLHGENDRNASVGELETGIRDTVQTSSPGVLSIVNNKAETMDTHDETSELSHRKEGTEDSFGGTKDNKISTVDEAAWEECGCILWDLSVNKTHAVFMVENLLLEVLLASLSISQSLRVTEIGLGILANMACHEVLRNRIVSMPGLIDTIIDQLFLDDSLCLCEAFRLLSLGLQGSDSVTWVNALQPEHILRRILWVVENTLNPQLLEKGISLLLAIIESQQEVAQTLLESLMKLGLPSLLVSLLACEMKHLFGERVPDRYSALDTLLRVLEALSVLDDHSEAISSNEELLWLIYNLIKLPDKFEVSSSCITAVVLIANVMTDKPDLASEASQDLSLLQGLLSLIPFVSNDLEARSALWSILGRVLVRVQEDEMSPPSLHQYVRVLVNKSDFIEEDLIDHRDEDSNEYHQSSNTSHVKETARTTSLSRICSILQRWITVGENIIKKDTIGEACADHENVEKLLQCCHSYTGLHMK